LRGFLVPINQGWWAFGGAPVAIGVAVCEKGINRGKTDFDVVAFVLASQAHRLEKVLEDYKAALEAE